MKNENMVEWLENRIKACLLRKDTNTNIDVSTLQRLLKYIIAIREEKNRLSDILDSI